MVEAEPMQAEFVVIGAMLCFAQADAANRALQAGLLPEHFTVERNRRIAETIWELTADGDPVAPEVVADRLAATGILDDVGGLDYLAEVADYSVTAGTLEYHARALIKAHNRREYAALLDAAQEAIRNGEDWQTTQAEFLVGVERLEAVDAGEGLLGGIRTLGQVLNDPSNVPTVVIPRFAWRGRTTLLAGREKEGKTTIATAAVAEVPRGGWWLGESVERGTALWCLLDEAAGDAAQRLDSFGADHERVTLWDTVLHPSMIAIALVKLRPTVCVIDHLAGLAGLLNGDRPDSGDAGAWLQLIEPVRRAARASNTALVIIHHARKDGGYRDSTAIGGAVDMILEITKVQDNEDLRRIQARGKWSMESYTVRLSGDRFQLDSGQMSIDARIVLWVEAHPGCSMRSLREGVGGRAAESDAALRRLMHAGAVIDQGDNHSGKRLFVNRQNVAQN